MEMQPELSGEHFVIRPQALFHALLFEQRQIELVPLAAEDLPGLARQD
jgi:hypothetical protein